MAKQSRNYHYSKTFTSLFFQVNWWKIDAIIAKCLPSFVTPFPGTFWVISLDILFSWVDFDNYWVQIISNRDSTTVHWISDFIPMLNVFQLLIWDRGSLPVDSNGFCSERSLAFLQGIRWVCTQAGTEVATLYVKSIYLHLEDPKLSDVAGTTRTGLTTN